MSSNLKETILLIENIEIDLKQMLLKEFLNDNLKNDSIQKEAFAYIQDKCLSLPLNIRHLTSNVVYRSYYRWLDALLKEDYGFHEKILTLLNTPFVSVYDFEGEIVSLRKQIENIITQDKRKLTTEVMHQHYLERKLREDEKRYYICLNFGEKSKIIDNLVIKYYNYMRKRENEYNKYCKDNNLKRSDWRCKILI